ncbi:hypothetical protein LCGC14_1527880, partial [marine sediment metagenome]
MFRQVRSRSPQSRRALPAGADRRLRSALKSMIGFKPSAIEMYAFTSSAGLRRRIRTGPVVPFETLDTPTDAPPAPKWASFTGGDGQFNGLVSRPQLLLPLRVLDSIIYQIDLASDSTFATNLETVSEGQTRAFNKGGFSTINRYARVRAKFPTSEWTGWTVFGLPTAVASGAVPTSLSELSGDLDDVSDSATRFAAEEANANRTETRTSADTALVSGTAAATVETGAVRANAGLDSVGDLARNVVTNRVIEGSILTGAVALAKLKTETSNRIFTSDAKRTNIEAKEPAEAGAEVTTGKSLTVLTDRELDNISDSVTRFAAVEAGANKTETRTAAAIAGQGALATKSAVDLATGEVTNKTAANIAETGARKWLPELA